jgi:hypothetical protein
MLFTTISAMHLSEDLFDYDKWLQRVSMFKNQVPDHIESQYRRIPSSTESNPALALKDGDMTSVSTATN